MRWPWRRRNEHTFWMKCHVCDTRIPVTIHSRQDRSFVHWHGPTGESMVRFAVVDEDLVDAFAHAWSCWANDETPPPTG